VCGLYTGLSGNNHICNPFPPSGSMDTNPPLTCSHVSTLSLDGCLGSVLSAESGLRSPSSSLLPPCTVAQVSGEACDAPACLVRTVRGSLEHARRRRIQGRYVRAVDQSPYAASRVYACTRVRYGTVRYMHVHEPRPPCSMPTHDGISAGKGHPQGFERHGSGKSPACRTSRGPARAEEAAPTWHQFNDLNYAPACSRSLHCSPDDLRLHSRG
jgi:hypothetical protein